VIIVPTKYYTVPSDRFKQVGVSGVIWANHNMRASAKAMKETSARIFEEQSLVHVEKEV
jgi:phosphoenolpyruvate phosphomutase